MVDTNTNAGAGNQDSGAPNVDVYTRFKELNSMYSVYKQGLEDAKSHSTEHRDVGLLQKLAVPIGPESIEQASLSQLNDTDVLLKFVKIGYKRNAKAFEEHGDSNLKEILKKAPKNNLEYMVNSVELKDSASDAKYNDALSIHKKYQEMYKNLADYQREDTTEDEKKEASKKIKAEVITFYGTKYKDDADMLDALKSLAEVDEKLVLTRYTLFTKDKRKEFDEKTKDNLDSYIKSAVKDKLGCYSILAADIRTKGE